MCSNTLCIPKSRRCNAECDCSPTCEDENEEECKLFYDKTNGVVSCRVPNSLSCLRSLRCVPGAQFLCDGRPDCVSIGDTGPSIDEVGCGKYIGSVQSVQSAIFVHAHLWSHFHVVWLSGESAHTFIGNTLPALSRSV